MATPTAGKTFTAGHGGARLRVAKSIYQLHQRSTDDQARYHARCALHVRDEVSVQDNPLVLDLGCGSRAAVPLALNALGVPNVGVDYDTVAAKPSIATIARVARRNGLERAAKTAARMALFDRRFYRELGHQLGTKVNWDGLRVRDGDAHHLQFEDDTFSFIHSVTVFEHLYDVPRAVSEMRRVLRPGGKAYVVVHLFPSLSGGHALDWADNTTPGHTPVPPWDHLRQNRFPAHVYLNKLRSADYLDAFQEHFDIVHQEFRTEGHELLTTELRDELSDWSAEDLTRRLLTVTLSKRQ